MIRQQDAIMQAVEQTRDVRIEVGGYGHRTIGWDASSDWPAGQTRISISCAPTGELLDASLYWHEFLLAHMQRDSFDRDGRLVPDVHRDHTEDFPRVMRWIANSELLRLAKSEASARNLLGDAIEFDRAPHEHSWYRWDEMFEHCADWDCFRRGESWRNRVGGWL